MRLPVTGEGMRATLLFLTLAWVNPNSLYAQAKGTTSFSAQIAHVDQYLFRGHVYSEEATALADLGVGIGKWSYRLHYSEPIIKISSNMAPFESEYVHEVSYTSVANRRVITYGYHFYDYSDSSLPDTQEIYSRVALDRKWNPTYGMAFDIDTYKGYYLDFSLTRIWAATRKSQFILNLRLGGSLDLDEKRNDEDVLLEPAYFDENGVNHGSIHFKYAWQPNRRLKLETGLDYHYAFDEALYDPVYSQINHLVWRTTISLYVP